MTSRGRPQKFAPSGAPFLLNSGYPPVHLTTPTTTTTTPPIRTFPSVDRPQFRGFTDINARTGTCYSKSPRCTMLTMDDNLPMQYDERRLDLPAPRPTRSLRAVHDTFDLIGGVPRLALWADKNPSDFYTKIWAKTIPTNVQNEHSGEITIRTAIPRGPLDGEYTDATPEP